MTRAVELLAPRGLRVALGAAVLIAMVVACAADAEPQLEGAAAEGQVLARQLGCAGCHNGDSYGGSIGPSWDGAWGDDVTLDDGTTVTYDEQFVRTAVRDPDAQRREGEWPRMPAYTEEQVSEDQLAALVAYLEALAQP